MQQTIKVNTSTNGGIGFFGLLTIIFIILKLIGKINWSWIWVLSPLWAPFGIFVLIAVIIFIIAVIAHNMN